MKREPLDPLVEMARKREEAIEKAWDSLARYKFIMFGYWAAIYVHLNRLLGYKQTNPFHELVECARIHQKKPQR